jgi:hypothetical protein
MAGKPPLRVGDALRLKTALPELKGPYYTDNAIRRVLAVTEVDGTQFVDVRIENAGGSLEGKVFHHQAANQYVVVTRTDDDPNGR